MDQTSAIAIIEEALELPSGSITMETVISETEAWDSVGWMALLALLDEKLSLRIDSKFVSGFERAGDVVGHILENATLPR